MLGWSEAPWLRRAGYITGVFIRYIYLLKMQALHCCSVSVCRAYRALSLYRVRVRVTLSCAQLSYMSAVRRKYSKLLEK